MSLIELIKFLSQKARLADFEMAKINEVLASLDAKFYESIALNLSLNKKEFLHFKDVKNAIIQTIDLQALKEAHNTRITDKMLPHMVEEELLVAFYTKRFVANAPEWFRGECLLGEGGQDD